MDAVNIWLQEYNNLWNEKLIHKAGIRKFHNYLTYLTAVSSLALVFYGVNAEELFKATADSAVANQLMTNATNILNLLCIVILPLTIVTLTFPINDLFHMYVIGARIAALERRINLATGTTVLAWEHFIVPHAYMGKKLDGNRSITNVISKGDILLLIPALFAIGVTTTVIATKFIYATFGAQIAFIYLGIILYMLLALIYLGSKLMRYASFSSPLAKLTEIREGES